MLRSFAVPGLLLLATSALVISVGFTQTAPKEGAATEFEVASIKPFVAPQPQAGRKGVAKGGKRGGPGTSDPGQITWNGATLKSLLMTAYNMKNYQISGPAWLDTERFSIVAKVPQETTQEQVLVMWQHLLEERFQLKLHRETKEIPIYELVVGKNGPKFKESPPDPEPPKDQPPKPADGPPPGRVPLATGPDGCPVFPDGGGSTSMMMLPGRLRMCAKKMTMEALASFATGELDRPVFDKTGLTGKYDFKFEFAPERQMVSMVGPAGGGAAGSASQGGPPPEGGGPLSGPNSEPAPPIAAAFQSQLGLKLEARKTSAEILVIDKIEKTTTGN